MFPNMIIAIFPYLETSDSIEICGITFRSTDDFTDLDRDDREHLSTVWSLFYLNNDIKIRRGIYAIRHHADDQNENVLWLDRLYRVQTLLGYLYASPSNSGDPFLKLEHSDLFLFRPALISTYMIWPDGHRTKNLLSDAELPESDEYGQTSGYHVYLNERSSFCTYSGSRIFPSSKQMYLNLSQDVHSDFMRYAGTIKNWPVVAFFNNDFLGKGDLVKRLYNAILWHNRSTAFNLSEEIAVLYLAIAFETLLDLEPGEKLTQRFQDTILTLLGPLPRLDSWIEQFYRARSKIVHEGEWHHLAFYPADLKIYKDILSGKISPSTTSSLTSYGWRIFRLCFATVVTGSLLAEDARLSSSFMTNDERLTEICKVLAKKRDPNETFRAIAEYVSDLENMWFGYHEQVDLAKLTSVSQSLTQLYLNVEPNLPSNVQECANAIATWDNQADIGAKLQLIEKLEKSIQEWRVNEPIYVPSSQRRKVEYLRDNPIQLFIEFLDFAASPKFKIQWSRIS